MFIDNKRFIGVRFGRQLDAKTTERSDWTPLGLHGPDFGSSTSDDSTSMQECEANI